MTWLEELAGFPERSPQQVRENISVVGEILTSHINGRSMNCGTLETPRLADLRQLVQSVKVPVGKLSVREVVANVQELHADKSNSNSMFQVASQLNLLEMVSPDVAPETGMGCYEYDATQGPACAIAAGAGTRHRNYFVPVNGEICQSADNQIDCLTDIGEALGNSDNHIWEMRSGYALASEAGLREITAHLRLLSEQEIDELRQLLRIGI